jgi:hypothetical protein
MTMHLRNATLAAAVAAVLGLAPEAGHAQDGGSPIKWYGSIYAKFLDGNRRTEAGLYSNAETTPGEGGGDQGQGIEFELMFNGQVSKQVEIGGRLHSRFNKNFWSNYGGFGVPGSAPDGGCEEDDPRCNQYIKLRGAWARITPGYEWMDSATIGNQDWGMFDPWTQGKIRYIDRDNLGGILLQGSALDRTLRWDLARITIPNYQNLKFASDISADDLYANDANWVLQFKYAPGPDWNATVIASYARDDEVDDDDPNTLNGVGTWKQFDNTVIALKGQYTGFDFMDVNGAMYFSDLNVDPTICPGTLNDDCRFQPLLKRDADDFAYYLNLNFNELFVDGLSLSVQLFDIGSDYVSLMAARRESDVLLTEGQEGTWMWGRPDYNFGNRENANSMAGLGWGGWNGEVQQVVSLAADNDFTDFDEPVAYSVIGWKGVTLVPKYNVGDWEFAAEYSYIDFNTNWQACGGSDKDTDCATYIRQDGVHAWGVGGDYRSPYAPYQDRLMQIFALRAMYTLDVGNGVDLMARYKYISDEDDRVTNASLLVDAYDGYPGSPINPDWVPNVGLNGCVDCDDRKADYDTFGFSAGYQLTPDLYAKLIYEFHQVELIDGTVDVAPVGMGFEASNAFGFAEYLTGKHEKNRLGLDFSYFLSGVEFGGSIDYLWGTYDPSFYTDSDGRRVKLVAAPGATSIATPLGNIPLETVNLGQYRMKIFMKVSF